MYLRFVSLTRNVDPPVEEGLFQAAYRLESGGDLTHEEMVWFGEIEAWFTLHLQRPDTFSRSGSTARRDGLSWLKESSLDAIARMRDLAAFLEYKGVPTRVIQADRPGVVVYEDEQQVIAVPFRDREF